MVNKNTKDSKKTKKKIVVNSGKGILYISSTQNNTLATLTDDEQRVIGTCSGGQFFNGASKKGTPYTAQLIGKKCAELAWNCGIRSVDVVVNGVGIGREFAIRAFANNDETNKIVVSKIIDRTELPHGGCRPKKQRRV